MFSVDGPVGKSLDKQICPSCFSQLYFFINADLFSIKVFLPQMKRNTARIRVVFDKEYFLQDPADQGQKRSSKCTLDSFETKRMKDN